MSPKRLLPALLVTLLLLPAAALAHGGGHVMGTIAGFDAKHLEVLTQDGKTQSIALTDATRYFVGEQPGTVADLAKGLRVVVHLAMDKTAMEVHLPAKK